MTKIGDMGYEHASYFERFASVFLDWIFIIIGACLALLVGTMASFLVAWLSEKCLPGISSETYRIITIALCLLGAYYFLWYRLFQKTGQTLGMRIMKIKSISAYGSKISWIVPFVRLGGGIGDILSSNSPNQSVTDNMLGTYTIKIKKLHNPKDSIPNS
jgi:uncharacterized RDD family membrane protein YckC